MSGNWGIVVAVAGAIPGILALAASLVGLGRLTQRLQNVETDVAGMKDAVAKVGVIEERTRNTDDNVKNIRDKLDAMTDTLLAAAMTEIRSYKPRGTRG